MHWPLADRSFLTYTAPYYYYVAVFPRIDFCHHPAIHAILVDTCKEFDIDYVHGEPLQLYKEMIHSFATQMSLIEEIETLVYAGAI